MKTRKRKIVQAAAAATKAALAAARKQTGRWFLALLCLAAPLVAGAQCPAENKAFKSGEQVVYDLYFNWKFI